MVNLREAGKSGGLKWEYPTASGEWQRDLSDVLQQYREAAREIMDLRDRLIDAWKRLKGKDSTPTEALKVLSQERESLMLETSSESSVYDPGSMPYDSEYGYYTDKLHAAYAAGPNQDEVGASRRRKENHGPFGEFIRALGPFSYQTPAEDHGRQPVGEGARPEAA